MERLFESVGARLDDMLRSSIGDRYVNPLKQSLGEEVFDAALAEGRAMSFTQAVQYALAETSHDRVPNDASRRGRAE